MDKISQIRLRKIEIYVIIKEIKVEITFQNHPNDVALGY